jgi:aminobenzoyl-glutamate transport protein
VAAVFSVNIFVKPLDGILVGITNDAIALMNPGRTVSLMSNFWFSIASVILLTVVVSLISDKVIEPRLGPYAGGTAGEDAGNGITKEETRGLMYASWGIFGTLAFFALLSLPLGAPLRNPETGSPVADSPFMNGLILFIALIFLAAGAAYGIGAGTMKGSVEVIKAMEKAVAGLGGLIVLLLLISQFNAFFTYTNMATLAAVKMGDTLEAAGLGALPLLIGFVFVVGVLDLIMTGAIPKWAIFAPIFVPLLMRLNVEPEAVLAAYRVGDSPINSVTPLNAYFALIVSFAMKYQKDAGVGTVIALMLPYVVALFVVWPLLLAAWHIFGLPWGI